VPLFLLNFAQLDQEVPEVRAVCYVTYARKYSANVAAPFATKPTRTVTRRFLKKPDAELYEHEKNY
jgi:hypothetical protein